MRTIKEIYNSVLVKHGIADREFYIVEPSDFNDSIKVGISPDGYPSILVAATKQSDSLEPVTLSGIEAIFNLNCIINEEEDSQKGCFHVITFRQDEPALRQFFFDFFEEIFVLTGPLDSSALKEHLLNLADLFSYASKKSKKTMMGLWSELLIILAAKDIESWASKWSEEIRATFDFSFGHIGIDVKSFGSSHRKHYFKYEQLHNLSVEQTIILSMCCKEDDQGESVFDLFKEIKSEIHDKKLISKLEQKIFKLAGSNITESHRFNFNTAMQTLVVLQGESIPSIAKDSFPSTVSEISFLSDCSDVPMMPFSEDNQAQLLQGVLVFPDQ
ncbi:PD-(D/E)XK motif protein [Gammaproteobacteria bacterium]|jgi:hypothetical protein|nr:PD-(D/E)XK motif protein [Gammaproteobacteria bacterium]|tara:strand:- start:47 stop:1033 length:987 start_codon:yes stop_codon:yes gene_type:complete